MKRSKRTLFLLVTVLLVTGFMLPQSLSESSQSYQLLNEPNGSTHYGLNVTVQQSLYDYYFEKSHRLNSNSDFAKFVTPYALEPIADSLSEIYSDDEDFANGVLMIVHQIPYEMTAPVKYPVETLVENEGDCDLFSYIAASILLARGSDAVLLYYESQAHMNIGVSLSHVPQDARGQAYYITYNDIRYYMAETTGGDWQYGWRVGECPDELKDAPVQVITLEQSEQWAPGQVSASYKALELSTISLETSATYLIQGNTFTFFGQLSPALQNETVTIYVKVNNSPWVALDTVTTNGDGEFTHVWNPEVTGICNVRASWSGNEEYAGADSQILTVTIMSMFLVLLLIMTVVLAGVGLIIFLVSKRPQQGIPEPQQPEAPVI